MATYVPSYCPTCGDGLTTVEDEGRARQYCPTCDHVVYRNPVPGAAVVVVDGDSLLLVRRRIDPGAGRWCEPGGHLEVDEPPAVGAARELEEETGLTVDPAALTLVDAVQMEPWGDKYIVTIGYAVERRETRGSLSPGTDASAARFVHRDDLSGLAFAFPYVPDRLDRVLARYGGE
jgi:ADP-ribose pyrophosphatase YjhB (NUDIX family)